MNAIFPLATLAAPVPFAMLATPKGLNDDARALTFNKARAKATIASHKANFRHYIAFCTINGLCALPAAPATIAAYIRFMTPLYAPGTVRKHFKTISVAHRRASLPSPMRAEVIEEAFRELYELKGRRQIQRAPINGDLRARIVALKGDALADLRDRAMIAVAYDSLARRCELAAMLIEDIEYDPEHPEEGGTILIRRSKTDQSGDGRVRFLAPDTLALVLAWLKAAQLASGVIFRSLNHSKIGLSISGEGICAAFKKRARQAGASAEIVARIGGHSCRVGAAQDMAAAGYIGEIIQQAGGWQSQKEMQKYIAHIKAKRGGPAQLAKDQNRFLVGVAKPTLQIQSAAPIESSLLSRILTALAPFANVAGFSFAPA